MSDSSGDAVYRLTNVEGTRAVAEAARAELVRHIIFSSSVKAIGEGGEAPLTDDTPESPQDAYGRSKLAAERVLLDLCDREQMTATILRFPLVYGPGVKGNLRRLFDAVWWGLPIPIGEVRNARSMLGIDNLVAFLGSVLERPPASRRPFLLSDIETVSTENLVEMIGSKLGRRTRVVKVPLRALRAVASITDAVAFLGLPVLTNAHIDRLTGSLVIDSSRAWAEARVLQPRPLDVGIARTAAWYLNTVRQRATFLSG
jgi:UDP-glucose 4-epimerase